MTDYASDADVLPCGYQLNEYKIRAVLGRGGFGITYIAEDVYLDHVVAIKEYCPIGLACRTGATVTAIADSDPEKAQIFSWGLQRFVDEARILARCRHPNIIRVIRYFECNGTAYLVMDFETGDELGTFRSRLGRPFSESELLGLMDPLMEGLAAIHRAGFLHRDIKPSNIMVRPDGTPVLLDFGAARQAIGTRKGLFTVIVTGGYAPIEQYAADGDQGPWTDVYGLGAVFYWALTGQKPPDALARMRRDPYQPVSQLKRGQYSERLLAAIDGALLFEPSDRFCSMDDWREFLYGRHPTPRALVERLAVWLATGVTKEPEARPPVGRQPPPVAPTPPVSTPGDQMAKRTFESWRKTVEGQPVAGLSRPPPPNAPRPPIPPAPRPPAATPAPVTPTLATAPFPNAIGPQPWRSETLELPKNPSRPPAPGPAVPASSYSSDATEFEFDSQCLEGGGTLILCHGNANIVVPNDGREYLIGRSRNNHLVLTDAVTSRNHARIVMKSGHFVLTDMSKFGTWVQYADGRIVRVNGSSEVLSGNGIIAFGAKPEAAGDTVTFQCPDNTENETVIDLS